jgi:hypothetical protein
MIEEMLRIAKDMLGEIDETIDGLPAAQITVLLSANNRIYIAVNDIDGSICNILKREHDTQIVKLLTLWKDGSVDVPSFDFRKALAQMNAANCDADVILQGQAGYLAKKLAATLPNEKSPAV